MSNLKKSYFYRILILILSIEFISYILGYKLINTFYFFIINTFILFLLFWLTDKKLLTRKSVNFLLITLLVFGFIFADNIYIYNDPSSSNSLIIEEVASSFRGYGYAFYTRKFFLFKQRIYGVPLELDSPIDFRKDLTITWIDSTTIEFSLKGIDIEDNIFSITDTI